MHLAIHQYCPFVHKGKSDKHHEILLASVTYDSFQRTQVLFYTEQRLCLATSFLPISKFNIDLCIEGVILKEILHTSALIAKDKSG